MAREQLLLVSGRQMTVVRHPHIVRMCDEVEHILFEIRTRAADSVDLTLPDHLRE
jgi:hypothetical protein